jgi:hypothetical protein
VGLVSTLTNLTDKWPKSPLRYEDELSPRKSEKCGGSDVIRDRTNDPATLVRPCPRKSELHPVLYAGQKTVGPRYFGEGKKDIDVIGFMEAQGGDDAWAKDDRQARSVTLFTRISEHLTFLHQLPFNQK